MIGKSTTNVVDETGKTGAVSQAINLAINNPTLWGFMRAGARKTMIKTAESSGIPWRQAVEDLRNTPEVTFRTVVQMMSDVFSSLKPLCSRLNGIIGNAMISTTPLKIPFPLLV